MAEWDDPDVQIVYELLCDTAETPPEGEHYEGWVARRIVAALRARQLNLPPSAGSAATHT